MIVKLTGVISEVADQSAIVERDGLAYEVLVPGFTVGELRAQRGREVCLHTLEFLEGNASSGNLVPRMAGFLDPRDRGFFKRFIEVKGIGIRKGLKALVEPVSRVAGWIAAGETRLLAKLPGIGKRGAELIVAELKDKIDEFVAHGPAEPLHISEWSSAQRDALEVMLAWGDSRHDVVRWLERAVQLHPAARSAEEWVKACYRIKSGSEG